MHLKSAVRMLVKDPSFTLVSVLALALGIGVNSTVFTFVHAVLVRGLPFPLAAIPGVAASSIASAQ